jgi:nicotinate-nucleotide adenylyltransferase
MRIGIFGGTFDPVHLGHLVMAEQCREQAGLDQVWFVLAARPPHKPEGELTAFARRVEMLQLALAGQPAFRVEELEKDRPGPSYTADTLEAIHRRQPDLDLHFIIGSDSLVDLPQWREPARIVAQAALLVVTRPGFRIQPIEEVRQALELPNETPLRFQVIESPLIDIASSDLRRRAAEGKSLRYQVPRAVECYIEQHQLYRKA